MTTIGLEHPAPAANAGLTATDIAERVVLLGTRIEALAQALIDMGDDIGSDTDLRAEHRRRINFVGWPLLDATREAGKELTSLGSTLEALQ